MLIALVGFIGSGKDSVAEYLVNKHLFKKESFADSVKNAVAHIFHWDRDLLEGKTNESRIWREQVDLWWAKRLNIPHLTPRWVLQNFATELCRDKFHKDIWIASLEKKLQNNILDIVISDFRFINELESIKNQNGVVIRIKRGQDPDWFNDAVLANLGDVSAKEKMIERGIHTSEWEWVGTKIDYTVENNSSLVDLYKKIDEIVKLQTK
jgi:hypothetical protein